MSQNFKKIKPGKGGKAHTGRKAKPQQKKAQGFKAKSNKKLTQNINKNLEEVIIGRAKEAKIRLKIAGQNRKKK